jgi:hypothetical protein
VTVSRNSPPSAVRSSHTHGRTSASAPSVSVYLRAHVCHRLRLLPRQSGAQEEDGVDGMEAKGCIGRRAYLRGRLIPIDTSKWNGPCARAQRQRRAETRVQWREGRTCRRIITA